jgi:hypothetical protein
VFNFPRQACIALHSVALIGCASPPVEPLGSRNTVERYRVLAISLTEGTTIQSEYELELRPHSKNAMLVRTNYSVGAVDQGGKILRFDSRSRTEEDPWPLLIQHVVASTELAVTFDEHGRPAAVTDASAWQNLVRERLAALSLPAGAHQGDSELLKPEDVLRDIRRTFPGIPLDDSTLRRPVVVGGVNGWVEERCQGLPTGRGWTCEGGAESLEQGAARVFGVTSRLVMRYDRSGLAYMETEQVGTLVGYDPISGELIDQAVGGKRAVERL